MKMEWKYETKFETHEYVITGLNFKKDQTAIQKNKGKTRSVCHWEVYGI